MNSCSCGKCYTKAYSTDYFSNYISLRWWDDETGHVHLVDKCPQCGDSADDIQRAARIQSLHQQIKRAESEIARLERAEKGDDDALHTDH